MSSIEERLARDIAAVTGGVVMTESDLRDAREAVVERIEGRRQRDRRRTVGAAVAAAILLPVMGIVAVQALGGDDKSAPAVDQPTSVNDDVEAFLTGRNPTPELVVGVWRVRNGALMLRLSADGEIRYDDGGRLFSDPFTVGTYSIAGDLITVDLQGECAGEQFAMRAALPEAGVMNVVQTPSGQATCGFDANERWVLEQVLPTNNEYLAGLEISESEVADLRPPPNSVWLHGDWMAQGGGHVLELAPDGSYYIAEGSGDVVDRGRWALDAESAQLRLLSDSTSSTCDQSDRLVMSGLGYVFVDGTAFIRATVDENTCGAAWTPPVWIKVPEVHI
jgi:hypothetical protein